MNNKDEVKPPKNEGEEGNQEKEKAGLPEHGPVENAHASGLGAMGRNDEKLPAGEGGEANSDDPVY